MTQSNRLVLYADDDPDDIELVRDAFYKYSSNIELLCFNDGTELIKYIDELEYLDSLPCLIILDINMPRMNGKETLKILRQKAQFEDIPVVLFTTSSLPTDLHFAERYKAGFITKPLDGRQMNLIIDQFIEHCTDEVKKNIRRDLT